MSVRRLLFAFAAVACFASTSSAEIVWGVSSVGGHVSLVSPSDLDSAIGFGADIEVAEFNENLTFGVNAQYWSINMGEGDFDLDFSDLAIIPVGTWRFHGDSAITPFVTGGLGIHRYKVSIPIVTFLGNTVGGGSATSTEIGLLAGGGAEYAMNEKTTVAAFGNLHVTEGNYFEIGVMARFALGGE